jgi:hypothetical protein
LWPLATRPLQPALTTTISVFYLGTSHLGDRNEHLPSVHGLDGFCGHQSDHARVTIN